MTLQEARTDADSFEHLGEIRPVEVDLESRLQLAFNVSPQDVQPFLPAGWVSDPVSQGPSRGAGLNLTFRIRHFTAHIDGEGRHVPGERDLGAIITANMLRPSTGERASRVLRSFSGNGLSLPGPYNNATAAEVTRRQANLFGKEKNQCEEEWQLSLQDGQTVHLWLVYQPSLVSSSDSKLTVYGGPDPAFHRKYSVEKGTEIVMSSPALIDRCSQREFRCNLEDFDHLLKAENVISVTAEPFYRRHVYPGACA